MQRAFPKNNFCVRPEILMESRVGKQNNFRSMSLAAKRRPKSIYSVHDTDVDSHVNTDLNRSLKK
jgi:hypothetical protein